MQIIMNAFSSAFVLYMMANNCFCLFWAQKRMDKEVIFGCEISVNFCNVVTECDFGSPCKINNKAFNSSNEVSGASSSSRDSSASPPRETGESKAFLNSSSSKSFEFPPPPVLDNQTIPSLLKNNTFKETQSQTSTKASDSFPNPFSMEINKDNKLFQLDWNPNKVLNHASSKNSDVSAFSPFKSELDSKMKQSKKNVGRVSPFIMQDCDKNGISHNDPGSRRACNQVVNTSSSCMFSNHGYSNSLQNMNSSFDIQPITESIFYSPSWNGTSTVNDSALSMTRSNPITTLDSSSCVELHVSNLDPAFDINDMKKILLSVFREHVMVLHISMCLQPDGSAKATVKVPTLQDAQYAISRLHRKKIGHKRILISHVSLDKTPPFHILKSETIALLNDIPNKSLPLIKFRELYEKRYHRPIAISELYKMREAVTIQGDSGSRVVYLNSEYCNTPSLPDSEDSQECISVERPYCDVHFHVSASQGWAEQYNICPLPLVHISLKVLTTGVHRLLDSHQGSLPLISFCDCYEAEIGPLPIVGNFISNKEESLEVSLSVNQTSVSKEHKGVPLEHLIACIAGVEVAKSVFCIKKVQWLENKTDFLATQNFSPALMGQLIIFGREVMDLLKSQPQCLVQFNKFIPTYHHHFGKQCRVADYGFTKLIDLLEAIPHIVQVLGEGQNRQVTLTHRSQVKRFAAELLRILKSRASKQITISEFPQAYEQVIEKAFEITNYGVCEIEDMLDEVPENVIVTSGSGSETIISIPKREQTPEEIERTKQFAEEVVELMKHTPNCSMAFNKFIPSYHHHFAKQCRVADYGFTKLIELFEAIPTILEVKGTGDDKMLNLVEKEQHKILVQRLITVIKAQPTEMVDITQLCGAYAQVHGHALRPLDFGFQNLEALLEKLHENFKVIFRGRRSYVCLVDHDLVQQLSLNVRRLLMEQADGIMPIKDVCHLYQARFGLNADLVFYFKDMSDVIKISGGFLQLTPLQLLARDIIILLQENLGQMPLLSLGDSFQKRFGVPMCAASYGFKSIHSLLENLSDYFTVKGKSKRRIVCLNCETAGYPLTPKAVSTIEGGQNNIDILNEPVPSCVPSPSIKPRVQETLNDLMGFETPPVTDAFCTAQQIFECKTSKENTIISIPNVIRASMTATIVTSETLYLRDQMCSSITNLTDSIPSLEKPTNFTTHISEISSRKNEGTVADLHENAERPIFSVLDVSKLCVSDPKQEVAHSNLNLKNSYKNHNGCEQLENFVSSPSNGKISVSQTFEDLPKYSNDSLDTKDGITSSKNTPTMDGKQQSRRNRIAAQFSSPINDY